MSVPPLSPDNTAPPPTDDDLVLERLKEMLETVEKIATHEAAMAQIQTPGGMVAGQQRRFFPASTEVETPPLPSSSFVFSDSDGEDDFSNSTTPAARHPLKTSSPAPAVNVCLSPSSLARLQPGYKTPPLPPPEKSPSPTSSIDSLPSLSGTPCLPPVPLPPAPDTHVVHCFLLNINPLEATVHHYPTEPIKGRLFTLQMNHADTLSPCSFESVCEDDEIAFSCPYPGSGTEKLVSKRIPVHEILGNSLQLNQIAFDSIHVSIVRGKKAITPR